MSILVEDITKRYKGAQINALNHVSLNCNKGVFGLLGPNGAGKTTLIRILATLITPTSGSATIQGFNVLEQPQKVRPIIGYVPQEYTLYPSLTAKEFLHYMGTLSGLQKPHAQIERVIDQVGLASVANQRLKSFSGGMKQRVVIAQALLHDPPVLLVDEPTAGLDPAERVRFRNLLSELGRERTVLLSTHIVEDITATCRQATILNEGKVAFSGEIEKLVSSAQGKVWKAWVSPEQFESVQSAHTIVYSRPTSQPGLIEIKFLTKESQPPFESESVTPTIEDAYLLLISTGNADEKQSENII